MPSVSSQLIKDCEKRLLAQVDQRMQERDRKVEELEQSKATLERQVAELQRALRTEEAQRQDAQRTSQGAIEDVRAGLAAERSQLAKVAADAASMQQQQLALPSSDANEVRRLSADIGRLREAMAQLESSTERRITAVEQQLSEVQKQEVRNMSFPDRILYFEKIHSAKELENGKPNRCLNLLQRQA